MLRKQNVVENVKDETTPCILPIVVVPKNHDKTKIRLCIVVQEANKSRENCKLDTRNVFLQFHVYNT